MIVDVRVILPPPVLDQYLGQIRNTEVEFGRQSLPIDTCSFQQFKWPAKWPMQGNGLCRAFEVRPQDRVVDSHIDKA
jgi:hypothetical protein